MADEEQVLRCCVCGDELTTHGDSWKSVAYCGDCGEPTCSEHRTRDAAQRCFPCARKRITADQRRLFEILGTPTDHAAAVHEHFADGLANGSRLDDLIENECANLVFKCGCDTWAELDALIQPTDVRPT